MHAINSFNATQCEDPIGMGGCKKYFCEQNTRVEYVSTFLFVLLW
jgi:hypothetical protein